MAINLAEPRDEVARPAITPPPRLDSPSVYDRSSLPGDCLVMIAGQSEADYLRKASDNQFCEYLDGIVYTPPRVGTIHQDDLNFLLLFILNYRARQPIGYVTTGPAALRLREGRWVEPDLFVLPEASRAQARAESFGFPPVLPPVEVLSPSNQDYGLEVKATAHREALVDEVWYVDRPDRVVVVDRREGDGTDHRRTSIAAGPVVARSLHGFWFDAAWFWREAQPNLLECMAATLAGPPGAA